MTVDLPLRFSPTKNVTGDLNSMSRHRMSGRLNGYSARDVEAIREFNWTYGTSFVWHREPEEMHRWLPNLVCVRITIEGAGGGKCAHPAGPKDRIRQH